jgi:dTDP-4-dehydrorhamnose reductase
MRVLVLGGTGMLGHRLWIDLRAEHDVWVTVRGDHDPFPAQPEFPAERVVRGVDARATDDLVRVVAAVRPELVVNAIGLIKQLETAGDRLLALTMNSLLPHRLAAVCRAANARLVHISTDCVFSGRRGAYTEADASDAEDVYGRTKFLGEVEAPHAVTLRTSIIGQELRTRLGLVEWFLGRTGTVRGYRRAIYSGLTTGELARVILRHVIPDPALHGLYHVSSQPISKYELLTLVKEAYGREVALEADDAFVCDRSLDSTRFRQATGYVPPAWPEMIGRMAAHSGFYERLRQSTAGS